jgi:hypothetical protein
MHRGDLIFEQKITEGTKENQLIAPELIAALDAGSCFDHAAC